MKGIKIILWICAVSCLLGFVAAVIPWKVMTAFFNLFGVQPFSSEPVGLYVFRTFMVMSGMVGVFFVILARDPLKYGSMFQLGAYGLLIVGISCLLSGIVYGLPVWLFIGDVVFCMLFGSLLIIFKKKAS